MVAVDQFCQSGRTRISGVWCGGGESYALNRFIGWQALDMHGYRHVDVEAAR